MRKRRILIIVNKNWECEPFLWAFKTYCKAEPFVDLSVRTSDNYMASCRAEFHLDNYDVIVRCIQDLMDDPSKNKSNSEEKYRVLPGYIAADKPDLVLSVSTAESTPDAQSETGSINGCVVVGGQYFMHDAGHLEQNPQSHLKVPPQGTVYSYNERLFEIFGSFDKAVYDNFKKPINYCAEKLCVYASPLYGCVGVVNVENYAIYERADPEAYSAYSYDRGKYPPMSIETTHGIVRMSTPKDISVIFISPITDRFRHFKDDVDEEQKQNHICAYNAGVAAAAFVNKLDEEM